MNLIAEIQLENEKLPGDYLRGFMLLIKKGFEIGDRMFYERLYGQKTDKPFTYAVYFSGLGGIGQNSP